MKITLKYPTNTLLQKELERLDIQYHKPIDKLITILINGCLSAVQRFPTSVNGKPFRNTGQWLIYQRDGDRINIIGLFVHNKHDTNDRELYNIIEPYVLQEYMPQA
jgi:hypothetical protein